MLGHDAIATLGLDVALRNEIETFEITFIGSSRAIISWTGVPEFMAWVVVNGQIVSPPLDFDGEYERSYELTLPDLFNIEILEGNLEDGLVPFGYRLEQYPTIHWCRAENCVKYRVWRKRLYSASAERLALITDNPAVEMYTFKPAKSQRQTGGVWNLYRAAGINTNGVESSGDYAPHWVPGLPARPSEIEVSGPYDNLVVTLTA